MEKLDRLVWAAGLAFNSYGVQVGIRVNRPEALSLLRPRLPPRRRTSRKAVTKNLYSFVLGGENPRRGTREFHLLYGGGVQLLRTGDLALALERFENEMQLVVAAYAPRQVFIHAGVVGWRGRAIIVPGKSHTGKTTLVRSLLRLGATYYSDEFAVVDADGRIHPYGNRLSLRGAAGQPPERVTARSLRAELGREPLKTGLIVCTAFDAAATWTPRAMTPGESALELLANTVPARLRPEAALQAVGRVASDAIAVHGVRGEADAVASQLLVILDAHAGETSQTTD